MTSHVLPPNFFLRCSGTHIFAVLCVFAVLFVYCRFYFRRRTAG